SCSKLTKNRPGICRHAPSTLYGGVWEDYFRIIPVPRVVALSLWVISKVLLALKITTLCEIDYLSNTKIVDNIVNLSLSCPISLVDNQEVITQDCFCIFKIWNWYCRISYSHDFSLVNINSTTRLVGNSLIIGGSNNTRVFALIWSKRPGIAVNGLFCLSYQQ